jgi:hypothetical protein
MEMPRPAVGCEAPAFTGQDRALIAAWAAAVEGCGLRTAIYANLFACLDEALLVSPCSANKPSWLIHKTPAGAIAVRRWPEAAKVVATLSEALAMIKTAVDLGDRG